MEVNMDKTAFFKLSYGLYIITTKYEEHFAGCVVNTVVQANSEKKPKLLVTVNKENDTNNSIGGIHYSDYFFFFFEKK